MSDIAAPVAPAVAATAPTGEAAPVVAKVEAEPSFELEIDGKKTSLTYTQARTELQKSRAADKRLQDATERRKEADALVKLFEDDPEAALRKAGKDPEKILAALLERKAKQALLTPEQQERAKLEKERDDLRSEKDKRDAESKAKADAELDQHNGAALEQQLLAAADAFKLDRTPETFEGLLDVGIELLDLLGPGITAEQVVQEYLRRDEEHLEARDRKLLPKLSGARLNAYLKANVAALVRLPAAELLEVLGPDAVKAIQAATLTKLPGVKPTVKPTAVAPPPRNGSTGRFMTEGQFDKKFPRR